MKHAVRKQAKRRRKNTTIAAGNPAPTQRLTLSPNSCDSMLFLFLLSFSLLSF